MEKNEKLMITNFFILFYNLDDFNYIFNLNYFTIDY